MNNSTREKPAGLGRKGEEMAIAFLKSKGYSILHTNWRFGKKELDIVAMNQNMLCVIEVKTRFGDFWEEPKEAVTRRKQKTIIETTEAYMDRFNLNCEVQFDIISIIVQNGKFEIEHIPDAFYPTLL